MDHKTFGIIGGMGTAAGILFQQIFMELCNKKGIVKDQSYPEWVFLNASKAPDRTKALKYEVISPVPYLVQQMQKMRLLKVQAVVVCCNTSHAFYEEVYKEVPIPWVHLQHGVADAIKQEPGIKRVAIMATDGTIRSHLYKHALESVGLSAFEPTLESDCQTRIMQSIYDPLIGIKATGATVSEEAKSLLLTALDEMKSDAVVAGCTELSIAFRQMKLPFKWFDPMAIAAENLYQLWIGERTMNSGLIEPYYLI
jgi:aspartate racemase